MSNMDKLKPCPFCGGEANVGQGIMTSDRELQWECDCIECGVMTAEGYKTRTEAITAWNRRTQPKNNPLTLNELKDELHKNLNDWLWLEDLKDAQNSCYKKTKLLLAGQISQTTAKHGLPIAISRKEKYEQI